MIIDAVKNEYIEEYNSEKFANMDIYVTKTFVAIRHYDNGCVYFSAHANLNDINDIFIAQSTGNVIVSTKGGLIAIKPDVLELLV